MWLAFILLPCNHLVPEETHKLILNHATTRQQTDRAVGLWQHIYHPPVIADTNCTALSSLLPVTQSSQGSTWKRGFGSFQQWEFMAHPACGPSCVQALCVPPKSLHVPLGPCVWHTGTNHPELERTTPKPRFWAEFLQTSEIPGDTFKSEPFMLVHEKKITNVQPMLILMVLAQERTGDWQWSAVLFWLHHPGQQQQGTSQPVLTERILSQIFLPQKLYSLLSSVLLSRLTDTAMKSF